MNTVNETTTAAETTEGKGKINWGSAAANTAVVGGIAVGGIIATGVLYGLVAKVAKVTYDVLS